ncbi:BREX system P-loop protein BrxC [Natronospora cellulosivora (SeqCode)]
MKIQDMFAKDINRDIKGVIKVAQDDEENVYQELEEYVVTNELEMHFRDFFEAYQKGIDGLTDKMGVWISGFFGSGKSHFLKILSYLLENREVKDEKAINFFNDKFKDQFILANMKRASEISTDVILFNIDSKSDSDSKNDKEAIVKVFMKVFNEYLGYCGSIPWLADLERQLDKDGKYQAFREKFKEISGDEWENRREDFYYEEDAIIESLVSTTHMSEDAARHWYETSEENYSLSIEKFAKRVQEYIEEKGNNHHLLFLVDEIGQYIGDDGQLMLNLQTVSEDLGTHCGGKAWVMVTSQEAIESVTKRIKGMDFSKIMGRFDTRLSLSSANVDEVIKKRILGKNQTAADTLELLYNDKSPILKNIITFTDDSAEMKNYSNVKEFVDVYPFVPYQFKLLQEVFEEIRRHGATGKHLSEGERSLLSAFQESVQKYQENESGKLIPFSVFYEPIQSFLDGNIRRVIRNAEENNNLEDYDVEVLKLLFLIRYVKGLPSKIENITTLMVSNINEDKIALKKKIEAALSRLIRETLIQKNGEIYYFLTNEEQDINREINASKVDGAEVIKNIGDIIFEEIYTDKKYRYSKTHDFPYNQMIDDKVRGRQTEDIGIKILIYNNDLTDQQLLLQSAGENNLIIKLPDDTTFIEELEQTLKIETYLRKRGTAIQSDTIEDIITRISREQQNRKIRVKNLLIDSLSQAKFFARNQLLDIKSSHPAEKINQGFKALIEDIYHKLNYVTEHTYDQREIVKILRADRTKVTLENKDANQLAVDEVNTYIDRQNSRNMRVTMKLLIERFSSVPYGWREEDIAAIVAKLLKKQEINAQYNGEILASNENNLVDYLWKRTHWDRLVIKKRVKVDQSLINNARKLARDLFEKTTVPNDEDNLKKELQNLIYNEITEINYLLRNYTSANKYPGKDDLKDAQGLFQEVKEIKDSYQFYTKLDEKCEDLIEAGSKITKIDGFFQNQKEFFDQAIDTIKLYNKNETYIVNDKILKTIDELKKIVEADEPYAMIKNIPVLRDEFNNVFINLLEGKSAEQKEIIENDRQKVKDELAKHAFNDVFKNALLSRFYRLFDRLENSNTINEIIAMPQESEVIKVQCFKEIEAKEKELRRKEKEAKGIADEKEQEDIVTPEPRKVETVTLGNVLRGTRSIENKEDIENLLEEIKDSLMKILDEDKDIRLI